MVSDPDTRIGGARSRFPATRRKLLQSLRDGDETERTRAWDTVVSLYWKPLYKYLRIRWGRSNEDAKDLIQSFFAHLLEKDALRSWDPSRGTFRTFLRTLFDRFAANEAKAASRQKRGGDLIHVDFVAAEAEIERQSGERYDTEESMHREWVRSLFSVAVDRLREELEAAGRTTDFAIFEQYDLADSPETRPGYRDLAERFEIPVTTVTNRLAAARRRFRAIVLEALREVTASEAEFEAEARFILGAER